MQVVVAGFGAVVHQMETGITDVHIHLYFVRMRLEGRADGDKLSCKNPPRRVITGHNMELVDTMGMRSRQKRTQQRKIVSQRIVIHDAIVGIEVE